MARKNYRLREGSLAWYCNEIATCFKNNWKAVVIVTIITALGAAFAWAGEENEPTEPNTQVTYKTCVESEYEPIPVIADVPLDANLQSHIVDVCESYHIEPELVLAVIGQESNYKSQKIGDDGESKAKDNADDGHAPGKMA